MLRLTKMVLGNLFRLPKIYLTACRYAKHPERYTRMQGYTLLQTMMRYAIEKGNVDVQVYGRENVPETDGFMIYANHQGLFDIIAFSADFRGPAAVVFKHELKNTPLLKQLAIATHSYPMDRQDIRQSLTVIRNVTEEVKNGHNYLIFPEGTRSKTGNKMNEFHSGSFKAATKAKCTILPVAFVDCFKVLDQKGLQHLTVQMHYLKPIPYEEYEGMTTTQVSALVKARIQEVLDQYAN